LLVAGEFWEDERLYRDLIRKLRLEERVTIHNWYVPNERIEAYFAAADVLVLPYLSGSQSGVGMLALNYGLPIIATHVGGLPETFLHERTGLIVPPADSSALARAMDRYFQDGLHDTFHSAMIEMRDRLSWEALIRIIEEISFELTSESNASRSRQCPLQSSISIGGDTGL
ncbi:MAG: glycosyltransferase family 4 protein, partial [Anaerolineae bacterium]